MREKIGCGVTCTKTYRSPAPAAPGAPRPLILIFAPSLIPAGTRVVILVGADPCGDNRKFNSVPKIDSLNPIAASVCKSAPWR